MSVSLGILAERPRSRRTTLGTYFDSAGVMKVAQPGFLRPNYVFQDGKWVFEKWLHEKKQSNYISNIDDYILDLNIGASDIDSPPWFLLDEKFISISCTKNDGGGWRGINYIAPELSNGCYFSTYIKSIGDSFQIYTSVKKTVNAIWNIASNGAITKAPQGTNGGIVYDTQNLGNGWYRIVLFSPTGSDGGVKIGQNGINSTGVKILLGGIMFTESPPGSYIPYSTTRTAD